MESIAVTLIGVTVTPIGVVESNSRSRAVMELKIDEPTFCDELAWGLAIAACIPVLLAAALSRQTLAHSDCYTTNETC